MTYIIYKGNMMFCKTKDGSIRQAPICDMVLETVVRTMAYFDLGILFLFYYNLRGYRV